MHIHQYRGHRLNHSGALAIAFGKVLERESEAYSFGWTWMNTHRYVIFFVV